MLSGKYYHYYSSANRTLALNNPERLNKEIRINQNKDKNSLDLIQGPVIGTKKISDQLPTPQYSGQHANHYNMIKASGNV